MIDSITPELTVRDVNKSLKFYRDILGFEVFMSVPEGERADYSWMWLKRGEASLMLESREAVIAELPHLAIEGSGSAILFFSVTEIDDLYAKLKNKVHLISDLKTTAYGSREFFVKDPDDYTLIFSQRV